MSFLFFVMEPEKYEKLLREQKNLLEKKLEKARRAFYWKQLEIEVQQYVTDFSKEEGLTKLTPEILKSHKFKKEGRAMLGILLELVNNLPTWAEANDVRALAEFVWTADNSSVKAIVTVSLGVLYRHIPFSSFRQEFEDELEAMEEK